MKSTYWILTATATAAIVLTMPAAQARTRIASSDPSIVTFQDLREKALATSSEADELKEIIERVTFAPQTHLSELLAIKDDVNRMGADILALDASQGTLQLWERQAYERVLPLVQDTADATTKAIAYYNANQDRLWGPEDEGYAERIHENAHKIASTLRNYLRYEKLQEEESAIQTRISGSANH